MSRLSIFLIVCVLLCGSVLCDVYMHNPRGSNNRLVDENERNGNRERDDAERLFDSENNARGGYEAPARTPTGTGRMYYYEGSVLPIEWTSQHSCNNPTTSCEIILQYMCDNNDKIRDGDARVNNITLADGSETMQMVGGANGQTMAQMIANNKNSNGPGLYTYVGPNPNNNGDARIPVSYTLAADDLTVCGPNRDCDTWTRYGRHESYDYWIRCTNTKQNGGLFHADQNVNSNGAGNNANNAKARSAGRTRQNGGGTRHGYECAEERDYYPYWLPSPWKDIAILTNDDSRCAALKSESQNVKGRSYCVYKDSEALRDRLWKQSAAFIPITEEECVSPTTYADLGPGTWRAAPANGGGQPVCMKHSAFTKDNSLGNAVGGYPYTFNWTVPSDYSETCVLRIRYNITSAEQSISFSTGDVTGTASTLNGYLSDVTVPPTGRIAGYDSAASIGTILTAGHDSPDSQTTNNQQYPTTLPIWLTFKFSREEVLADRIYIRAEQPQPFSRGYVFENNAHVDIFGELIKGTDAFPVDPLDLSWQKTTPAINDNNYDENARVRNTGYLNLRLALNTAQFSRTFQDRSYVFSIRQRPAALKGYRIFNLNVKGKRGNIVETFPSTEYDFTPNHLVINKGDLIHFQWGGSDYNYENNDPENVVHRRVDRNNVIILRNPAYNEANVTDNAASAGFMRDIGGLGMNYPGLIDESSIQSTYPFLGLNIWDLNKLAYAGLNYSYFDLGPRQVTRAGVYHYMSSRNNNFSNRGQKATIKVLNDVFAGGVDPITGKSIPANPGYQSANPTVLSFTLNWGTNIGESYGAVNSAGQRTGGAYLSVNADPAIINNLPLAQQEITIIAHPNSGYATDWFEVQPRWLQINEQILNEYGGVWLIIPLPISALQDSTVYWKGEAESTELTKVENVEYSSSTAAIPLGGANQGGFYVIKQEVQAGPVAAIVLCSVFLLFVCAYMYYKVRIQPSGGMKGWLKEQKKINNTAVSDTQAEGQELTAQPRV